jgi:ribose transport system permease protein
MLAKRPLNFRLFYEKFGIILLLLLEILIFSITSKNFLTVNNLFLVARQVSFYGIAAVGMTMVLLVGHIDISVGAILAFSGCLAATLMTEYNLPIYIAVLISIGMGGLFGLVTGTVTTVLNIYSLITSLAMQIIIKGFTFLMTRGASVKGLPTEFKYFGQGYVFDVVPVPVVIMLVTFLLGFIILNTTYLGRRIYAVGGNTEAARLSGIHTKSIVIITFVISGITAGIAGVLMAARLGVGQPSTGADFAMDVLTATMLGGISLQGGKGFVLNALLGSFIIGILTNGLVMLGVMEYWQWIIKGLVFITAVAMSSFEAKKS